MLRMPGSACCAPPAWPGALSLTFAMRLAAPRLTATLVTRPDPYQTSALDVADCIRAGPRQLHVSADKDVYGHLVEGDKRAAAESMSGLLFGTGRLRRGSQRGSQGDRN